MANCNDYISADDLKTGKQAILHIEHVAKSRDANGNHALDVTDTIRDQSVTNKTLDGLENLYNQAISQVGYITMDSFEDGATLTLPNQVLRYEATGEYYRWDGEFPKTVSSGSTPETAGGVGLGAWVSVGDASLRSELSKPTGAGMIGINPSGNIQQSIYWVTPEQFGAVGDGVAEDITAFRDACLSGYNVRCKKGARYKLSMTEGNVITLPAGVDVDLNGATSVVPNTGYLVFLLKNPRCSVRNGKIEYTGGYPTSAVATTRYGISRPHEAAFCGFIGLNTTAAQDITIDNIEAYGASDSNLYDFVISGYEGSFTGTKITRIRASHYACMIINNLHGVHMQGLYGTKRHNKSSLVYGPSHLAYVGMDGGTLRDVFEVGPLLSNESALGYAGATVQTTGINYAVIDNVNTTMPDVSALSVKLNGIGFRISNIYSKSLATFSQPQALVEIQTNLQATIQDGFINNVRVYLPTGNLGCVGYRHGGTRVKARNIYVDVPYTDNARTSEVAMLITSDYPDVELDIRTSKLDSRVLLSAFNNGRLTINNLNNPISLTSGTSINGAGWGENKGTEVSIQDNPTATVLSTIDVAAETRRKCIFNFAEWYNGDFYRHIINQSTTDNISLTVPVRVPPTTVSSEDHNVLVYEVDIVASSINGAQAVSSKHFVFLIGSTSSVTGTTKDIVVSQLGVVAIVPSIAFSGSVLTVAVTRQSGGENLRDLTVRVKLINNKPHI